MPIYEYQCAACGHQFETIQKFNEEPLESCPICLESALKKLVSQTSFQLKGTGWYVTDFRDKGEAKKKTDTKEAATTESSSTTTKAEETGSTVSSSTSTESKGD